MVEPAIRATWPLKAAATLIVVTLGAALPTVISLALPTSLPAARARARAKACERAAAAVAGKEVTANEIGKDGGAVCV